MPRQRWQVLLSAALGGAAFGAFVGAAIGYALWQPESAGDRRLIDLGPYVNVGWGALIGLLAGEWVAVVGVRRWLARHP